MWMAMWCCACTEQVNLSDIAVSEPTKLIVTLRIDADALRGESRADGDYGATLAEEAIHSLTLFYTTLQGGAETVEGHQTVVKPDLTQLLRFELPATRGLKRFYLAANMREEQIGAFSGDRSVYGLPLSDLSAVYSNADQLMEIDPVSGAGGHVLMTARITQGGQQDVSVSSGEVVIDRPVRLERVVSKVLLTCKESVSDGVGYVQVRDDAGWTRLEDVRYMGNMFSRKCFLFPQRDEDGVLMDANYVMGDLVARDRMGNFSIRSDRYKEYMDNFQFYDLYQQIDKLKASDVHSKLYHKAVKYDASRLDPNSKNLYTEGLYFVENRVKNDLSFTPMGDYSLEETVAMTCRLVSTHLLVAARFVPRKVVMDDAGALEERSVASEQEMLDGYLTECSEVIAGEKRVYPAGTFWFYEGTYFTLKGMLGFLKLAQKEGRDIGRADMERFDGGWGYYYTFIDGPAVNGVISHQGQSVWGLERNHYYKLNVTQITPPGAAVPGNKLMKIPTQTLDWVVKGESDVTVVP